MDGSNFSNPGLDPRVPIGVTLSADDWNTICTVLHEVLMPMRITRPLYERIMMQINAQIDGEAKVSLTEPSTESP
jgi:hypothetical protein